VASFAPEKKDQASDAANSGIPDVIKEATATKIFLPNPNAPGRRGGNL
jgi:hypothetical protein